MNEWIKTSFDDNFFRVVFLLLLLLPPFNLSPLMMFCWMMIKCVNNNFNKKKLILKMVENNLKISKCLFGQPKKKKFLTFVFLSLSSSLFIEFVFPIIKCHWPSFIHIGIMEMWLNIDINTEKMKFFLPLQK